MSKKCPKRVHHVTCEGVEAKKTPLPKLQDCDWDFIIPPLPWCIHSTFREPRYNRIRIITKHEVWVSALALSFKLALEAMTRLAKFSVSFLT
jgi:hypothetical protein